MKKYGIYIIVIMILFGCSSNNKKADAYGNFEADEIVISAESNGKIMKFYAQEGDSLKKGDVICDIDSLHLIYLRDELSAKNSSINEGIDAIQHQLNQVKIEKGSIDREIKRFQNLVSSNAATQKQLDDLTGREEVILEKIKQIKSQKKKAEFEKKAILSKLSDLNYQIKKTRIISPINGVILKKFAEENELANMGKPLVTIANLDQITLKGYVSGEQLPQLRLDQEVTVKIDWKNKTMKSYKGKVYQIADKAEFTPKIIQTKDERTSLVYAVKIRIKNDGYLKIGMPAEIEF